MKHSYPGKALAILLCLAMVFCYMPLVASAATFTDTLNHWGQSYIDQWSGYDVIKGNPDGSFGPDDLMTRGQAASAFAELFNLPMPATVISHPDVPAGSWLVDPVAKVENAKIMQGVGGGLINPNGFIKREDFFLMLGRGLGIREQAVTGGAPADGSAYSTGMINALTDKGFVKGDGTGVNALANINRASVMALFSQTITTYANKPGQTVNAEGKGVVLVVADDVTVKGEAGLVVVGNTDGTKGVTLDGVKADQLSVVGGAEVAMAGDTKVDAVVITESAEGSDLTVGANATAGTIESAADNAAIVNNGTVTGAIATTGANADVTNKGSAGSIETAGAGSDVKNTGSVSGDVTAAGAVDNTGKVEGKVTDNTAAGTTTPGTTETTEITGGSTGGSSHHGNKGAVSELNIELSGDMTLLEKSLSDLVVTSGIRVTQDSSSDTSVEVVGALKPVTSPWTAFSSDTTINTGYYLPIKITKPADVTPTDATVIKWGSSPEREKTSTGTAFWTSGDYAGQGDNLVQWVGATTATRFNDFYIEIDWDGDGTAYRTNKYTVDLSGAYDVNDAHSILVDASSNGTAIVNYGIAAEGVKVTVKAIPATGYYLSDLRVVKASAESETAATVAPTTFGSDEEKDYTFTMAGEDVKVEATFADKVAYNATKKVNYADLVGEGSALATASRGDEIEMWEFYAVTTDSAIPSGVTLNILHDADLQVNENTLTNNGTLVIEKGSLEIDITAHFINAGTLNLGTYGEVAGTVEGNGIVQTIDRVHDSVPTTLTGENDGAEGELITAWNTATGQHVTSLTDDPTDNSIGIFYNIFTGLAANKTYYQTFELCSNSGRLILVTTYEIRGETAKLSYFSWGMNKQDASWNMLGTLTPASRAVCTLTDVAPTISGNYANTDVVYDYGVQDDGFVGQGTSVSYAGCNILARACTEDPPI